MKHHRDLRDQYWICQELEKGTAEELKQEHIHVKNLIWSIIILGEIQSSAAKMFVRVLNPQQLDMKSWSDRC